MVPGLGQRWRMIIGLMAGTFLLAACGASPAATAPGSDSAGPDPVAGSRSASLSMSPTLTGSGPTGTGPTSTGIGLSALPAGSLKGRVIAIDPGHNGANWRNPSQINRRVSVGNGTKACDTTGTQSNAGYAEAAFTFDVATRLATVLRAAGAEVVLTRPDNSGVGPCITERAAIGNRAKADAAISIHADGAAASGYGFHVIVPRGIGSNDTIVAPSRRLGEAVRDAFRAGAGEPLSTYTGTTTQGIVSRSDLGGLNLSRVPKIFIECGNMRNSADAKRLGNPDWRQQAAVALAAGLADYLGG